MSANRAIQNSIQRVVSVVCRQRRLWLSLLLTTGCLQDPKHFLEAGVDRDKRLYEVDGEELQNLCEASSARFAEELVSGRSEAIACTLQAAIFLEALGPQPATRIDLDQCEHDREQCRSDRGAYLIADDRCGKPIPPIGLATSGCSITVREYERCFTATLARLRADIDENWTCQRYKDQLPSQQPTSIPVLDAPPECEVFRNSPCPFDASRW